MKKLLNSADDLVDEMLEGIVLSHPRQFTLLQSDSRVIVRAGAQHGVGVVTGGGSGHLPLFLGYIGEGLLTSAAVGNIFSAQSSDAALEAIRAASAGSGVLVLIGNYTGDRLNFELARDLAEAEGIPTRLVIGTDDVLSSETREDRRGVAGVIFAFKCAGAAAARGDDLETVTALAARVVSATASAGVGLSPAILPTTRRPSFTLPDGQMEIGIGIHGEPGVRRVGLGTADDVADELLRPILADLGPSAGSRVALLVNGLGATSPEELYVLARRAHHRMIEVGLVVHRTLVGEFATSMEMAGASLSVLVLDDELCELLDAPASSPLLPSSLT